jgi:hypothetical protein
MDASDEQFTELLANLVPRANRMLEANGDVSPIGLLLLGTAEIDVSVAVIEAGWPLREALTVLQEGLIGKIKALPVSAGCVAYREPERDELVVLMENKENYCATLRIPISRTPPSRLNLAALVVEDGSVFLFGA